MQISADKLFGLTYRLLEMWHLDNVFIAYMSLAINFILLGLISVVIYRVSKFVLVKNMNFIAYRTKTTFDDLLVTNKTVTYIAHLIPLVLVYKAVPIILKGFHYWEGIFRMLVEIYIVFLILWISRTIFNSLRDYLKSIPKYSDKPIDSYIQVIMIVLWTFGSITIILILFDTSFGTLVGTFGAVSAVIILIFRDTILGFVASIQVSVNDMVRIGDWITMEKFGADGDVIEINLATVKVRNFDKTTTTIPTYSLISDSFKNWRGMLSSDGRRIKRHLLIKTSSIRFLVESELENLKNIELVADYIDQRNAEINIYNTSNKIDKSLSINGRNLTNFGLFRKYLTEYLKKYPPINSDMTLLCRQLQPTQHGVPLEIYAFSHDQDFENYEYIIADIFDHIIASVGYFDLEIFESPSYDRHIHEKI